MLKMVEGTPSLHHLPLPPYSEGGDGLCNQLQHGWAIVQFSKIEKGTGVMNLWLLIYCSQVGYAHRITPNSANTQYYLLYIVCLFRLVRKSTSNYLGSTCCFYNWPFPSIFVGVLPISNTIHHPREGKEKAVRRVWYIVSLSLFWGVC
jgi:hypothetical protein